MTFDWDEIERDFRQALGDLDELRLDRGHVERMAREIVAGRVGPEMNRISGRLESAGQDEFDRLEAFAPRESARYADIGRRALARGEVAAAVLNGGMATRFGGAVKGIVSALGSRTFLELKLAQARSLSPAPFVIMNSFATHTATERFLAKRDLGGAAHTFLQGISLRLTREGEIFRDDAGRISLYAPGHGDFPEAMRESGTLALLRERGVATIMLSNIDNLGAVLDPVILGYHLDSDKPLTAEVAETVPGDAGGAPAFVDGALQIVEGFRWPEDFDLASLPVINTNTFVMSIELVEQVHPLTWFYVEKDVDGRIAVQMERLVNELSARVETNYLVTPRSGPGGRFFPTKTREDLARIRQDPSLAARYVSL